MLVYHQLTLLLVESVLDLSYLRSASMLALTPIWKVNDLYGPKGTKEALIDQQCRSRETLMLVYDIFLALKS